MKNYSDQLASMSTIHDLDNRLKTHERNMENVINEISLIRFDLKKAKLSSNILFGTVIVEAIFFGAMFIYQFHL
jgi:hypothetical protein